MLMFSVVYFGFIMNKDDLRPRFDLQAFKKIGKSFQSQLSTTHTKYDELIAENIFDEVKVICLVMTYSDNHKAKALHVKNTWGKRCNKLLFFSNTPDEALEIVVLNITESRDILWNKTKEAFKDAYENHFNDGDWFMKADDDS